MQDRGFLQSGRQGDELGEGMKTGVSILVKPWFTGVCFLTLHVHETYFFIYKYYIPMEKDSVVK